MHELCLQKSLHSVQSNIYEKSPQTINDPDDWLTAQTTRTSKAIFPQQESFLNLTDNSVDRQFSHIFKDSVNQMNNHESNINAPHK